MRKTSALGQVRDDLLAFHASVIVLVDEEWFDDDENLMHVRTNEVIKLVQDPDDDLDKEMPLLVLERTPHEQREDLVEQRTGSKFPSL